MHIESYNFSGTHIFCLREDQLEDILVQLNQMISFLSGSCRIPDNDSDSYVILDFEKNSLKISGQLGGSYSDNFMCFTFLADQTAAQLLADALCNLM